MACYGFNLQFECFSGKGLVVQAHCLGVKHVWEFTVKGREYFILNHF